MPIRLACASDYNKNHSPRKGRDNETIILVANRRFGWVDCDEHIVELAPHIPTLSNWKNSKMTSDDWKKFSKKYTDEIKSAKSQMVIQNLWERSNNGEMIKLVCYEKDDNPYCHRYMLKLFIDEYAKANG
jgi:uncharacterized protein YeaO (DUF488 family)